MATPSPDVVAPGLAVDDVTLLQDGTGVPLVFAAGNPGAAVRKTGGWADAGYYLTEITASPGVTFQITKLSVDIITSGSSGENRSVRLNPNGEGFDTIYGVAGGPLNSWHTYDNDDFNSLFDDIAARTDLTSLEILVRYSASSGGASFGVDNILVEGSAVPEPSTWLLAAMGLVGLGLFARRRIRQARGNRQPLK